MYSRCSSFWILFFSLSPLAVPAAWGQTPPDAGPNAPLDRAEAQLDRAEVQLDRAEATELLDGDREAALRVYTAVAEDESVPPSVRARAWLRVATAERARRNLGRFQFAAERARSLSEPESEVGRAARDLLEGWARSQEEAAKVDWLERLMNCRPVRSHLLELVTDLASDNEDRRRDARNWLLGYGWVALPTVRAAHARSTGEFRVDLAELLFDLGDWRHLSEIVDGGRRGFLVGKASSFARGYTAPPDGHVRLREYLLEHPIETQNADGRAGLAVLEVALGVRRGFDHLARENPPSSRSQELTAILPSAYDLETLESEIASDRPVPFSLIAPIVGRTEDGTVGHLLERAARDWPELTLRALGEKPETLLTMFRRGLLEPTTVPHFGALESTPAAVLCRIEANSWPSRLRRHRGDLPGLDDLVLLTDHWRRGALSTEEYSSALRQFWARADDSDTGRGRFGFSSLPLTTTAPDQTLISAAERTSTWRSLIADCPAGFRDALLMLLQNDLPSAPELLADIEPWLIETSSGRRAGIDDERIGALVTLSIPFEPATLVRLETYAARLVRLLSSLIERTRPDEQLDTLSASPIEWRTRAERFLAIHLPESAWRDLLTRPGGRTLVLGLVRSGRVDPATRLDWYREARANGNDRGAAALIAQLEREELGLALSRAWNNSARGWPLEPASIVREWATALQQTVEDEEAPAALRAWAYRAWPTATPRALETLIAHPISDEWFHSTDNPPRTRRPVRGRPPTGESIRIAVVLEHLPPERRLKSIHALLRAGRNPAPALEIPAITGDLRTATQQSKSLPTTLSTRLSAERLLLLDALEESPERQRVLNDLQRIEAWVKRAQEVRP